MISSFSSQTGHKLPSTYIRCTYVWHSYTRLWSDIISRVSNVCKTLYISQAHCNSLLESNIEYLYSSEFPDSTFPTYVFILIVLSMASRIDQLIANINILQSQSVLSREEFCRLEAEYNDLKKMNSFAIKIEQNTDIKTAAASLTAQQATVKVENISDDVLVKLEPSGLGKDDNCHTFTSIERDFKLESEVYIDDFEAVRPISSATSDTRVSLSDNHPFECEICSKRYPRKYDLKKHLQIHTAEKPYTYTLKRHCSAERVDEKSFQCDLCGYQCRWKSKLNVHKCKQSGKQIFQCFLCKKIFSLVSNLRLHMNVHTDDAHYQCQLSENKFATSNELRYHSQVHTKEKSLNCKVCNKRFATVHRLRSHVRTHTGEEPYECKICEKRFGNSTNNRPYACDICGKTFKTCGNVKVHRRIHTGERPFQWEFCNTNFVNSHHLKRHMKKHSDTKQR